jgi:hypothetical protein
MERRIAIEEISRELGVAVVPQRPAAGREEAPLRDPPAVRPPDSLREVDRLVGCIALFAGVLPALGAMLNGTALGGEACLALILGLCCWWLLEH